MEGEADSERDEAGRERHGRGAPKRLSPVAERKLDIAPRQPRHGKDRRHQRQHEERARLLEAGDPDEGEDRLVIKIGAVADQSEPDERPPRQPAPRRVLPVEEEEHRHDAGDRDHGRPAGKRHGGVEQEDRRGREGEAEQPGAGGKGRPSGQGRARPRLDQRRDAARAELPAARRDQIEIGRRRMADREQAEGETCRRRDECQRQRPWPLAERIGTGEQQRDEQIILLLGTQRPGVHERLELGFQREIAGRHGEQDIIGEQRRCDQRLAEILEIVGQHQPPGQGDAEQHRHVERRNDAAHPAGVEAADGEAAAVELAADDAGDQIAADHEEDVDSEKAAGKAGDMGVEQDDREHGDAAQPVHLRPVSRLAGWVRCFSCGHRPKAPRAPRHIRDQPRDVIVGRKHALDRADALARAPDVPPRLGLGVRRSRNSSCSMSPSGRLSGSSPAATIEALR